jgi:hypothetical protein
MATPKGLGRRKLFGIEELQSLLSGQPPGFYAVGLAILGLAFGVLLVTDKAIDTADRLIQFLRRLRQTRRED